jgi:hypothetical protein
MVRRGKAISGVHGKGIKKSKINLGRLVSFSVGGFFGPTS